MSFFKHKKLSEAVICRIHDYHSKYLELGKALDLFEKSIGKPTPNLYSCYAEAIKGLHSEFKDIAEVVNNEWDYEFAQASKTGDYKRLAYLSPKINI